VVHPSILDKVTFLQGLDRSSKEDLAARAIVRRYPRGRRLWNAGDPPQGLFVILEGHVRVVRAGPRRVQAVHTEGPGATLGEVPLFAGGTYPATATAGESCVCLILDRQALANVMDVHPEVSWALLRHLAARLRLVLDRLAAQGSDPAIVRLAAYLVARPARPDGGLTFGGTQQALAEELGTVREVVVRLLGRLQNEGVIERTGRGRFLIRDSARLRKLAAGDLGVW